MSLVSQDQDCRSPPSPSDVAASASSLHASLLLLQPLQPCGVLCYWYKVIGPISLDIKYSCICDDTIFLHQIAKSWNLTSMPGVAGSIIGVTASPSFNPATRLSGHWQNGNKIAHSTISVLNLALGDRYRKLDNYSFKEIIHFFFEKLVIARG